MSVLKGLFNPDDVKQPKRKKKKSDIPFKISYIVTVYCCHWFLRLLQGNRVVIAYMYQ